MPGLERDHFEAAYAGDPPWEIGRPQREIVRLVDEGEFRADVLDIGCGTGENALLLASRGHPVVGVDVVAAAIERARDKAAERGLRATFLQHDALDLGALKHRFTTAVDSGVFHVFSNADRARYVESVAAALGPGGVLHLLCFSDEEPPGEGPRRVGQWELRQTFQGAFAITRIREARYEAKPFPEGARAWLATMVRI